MPVRAKQRLCFGPFEFDDSSAELFKFGQKLKLQGQPIQILSILLEKPGELVTREELRQRLWPAETETFVDFDHGLNTDIRKLRQALGDEAETPQYIETLPRRGYRFIGRLAGAEYGSTESTTQPAARSPAIAATQTQIAELTPTATADVDKVVRSMTDEVLSQKRRYRRLRVLLAGFTILLCLFVFGFLWVRSGPPAPKIRSVKQLTFCGWVGSVNSYILENYSSIQTDGHRIYYMGCEGLSSLPIDGGNETILQSPGDSVLHISPDGFTLLVKTQTGSRGDTESAVWLVAADGSGSRRLGNIEAQDAAWAPDGKTIVFAKGENLYLTDVRGTTPVKLASTPGRAFWLRWSPDGRVLRFTLVDSKKLSYGLWELRPDGKLSQLLTGWKGAGQVCCGVWTADSKYFLFRNLKDGRFDYWAISEKGFSARRREPTLLSPGGMQVRAATVSPSQQKILIDGLAPSIYLLRSEANGRMSVFHPELQAGNITFSRDGQFMAYIRNSAKGGELWRARADGSDKLQLTVAPMEVLLSQYSPDGKRIAFMARWPNQPWKILWVSNDGGTIHAMSSKIVNQADPNWSLDGQSIIFGQPPDFMAESGAPRVIYRYDLRTEQTSEIPGSAGLFSPRLSPDGRYLAAMSVDFQGLSLLDLSTGKWRSLIRHFAANTFWSLDSTWVYFYNGGEHPLGRVRASDGRFEQVPVTVNFDISCADGFFAPDGSILLGCSNPNSNLYVLDWE